MSVWLHISGPLCVVDAEGVVHAAWAKPRDLTYTAQCGAQAKPLAFEVVGRPDDRMTVAWPVYVKQAKEWGYARCRACMKAAPGRPQWVELAPGGAS